MWLKHGKLAYLSTQMRNFFNISKSLGTNVHQLSFILLMVCCKPVVAQVVQTDSAKIYKVWKDKNGENKLTVNVNALCNPAKPPFDGHKTKIKAVLKNKNFVQEIVFDDKDYQMEMILFRENDMWFSEHGGTKAVFIPFFYCGNADNDVKASFIIFYGNKKYLYHLKFYCDDAGNCTLREPNLGPKLKDLPNEIKDNLMRKLKADFSRASKFGS